MHSRIVRRAATRAWQIRNASTASRMLTTATVARPAAVAFKCTTLLHLQQRQQGLLQRRSFASLPEFIKLEMPALSPTMERGNIASWNKKEGDVVNSGDILAEVETDKATVSFDSTEDGYIAKILVPAGTQDVPVGTVLAIMVEDESDVAAFKDYVEGAAAPTPAAAPAAKAAAPTPVPTPAAAPAAAPAAKAAAPAPVAKAASAAPVASGDRVVASPFARKLAGEKGIPLNQVVGTGIRGRIVAADINEFKPSAVAAAPAAAVAPTPAASKAAAPAAVMSSSADYTDVPASQMRKIIAQRLTESKQQVPHYYLSIDVNMDAVLKLRARLNARKEQAENKISVNDFIIKASAAALRKVPAVNSSWMGTFVRAYNYVDISVAVSTPAGLMTPIVSDADCKGLGQISSDVKALSSKARNNKLLPAEYQGGTFTISNLGMFGITNFAAIINPPQACILAVGAAQSRVVVNPAYTRNIKAPGDIPQFIESQVMTATASYDHRVVDGAVGAEWLASFKALLEDPETLLL